MPTDHVQPSDLRGAARLAIDATVGITDLVEEMYRNIGSPSSVVGKSPEGATRGIAGLVYRTVRGVTKLTGGGIDAALASLIPLFGEQRGSSRERDAVLAALNGVLGDYLAATANPLAITMQLRANGQALVLDKPSIAAAFPKAGKKVALMIHGLCMNDQQWLREGHDHGAALARDLGYTPVYIQYNSGLHISSNGHELADLLERLVAAWPSEIEEITIVAHSMGGLVARSAYHYAALAKHHWPQHANKLIFLGTPHHGAPLERAGNWVDMLLGVSPYIAPFARLSQIRSAGITDLRHGNLRDEDWQDRDRFERHSSKPHQLPLPANVKCFAVAATLGQQEADGHGHLLGDGLVPVASALGRHTERKRNLRIPPSHRWIGYGMGHMQLLSSPAVYTQIAHWLNPKPPGN